MTSKHPSVYHRQPPDSVYLRNSTRDPQRPQVDPIIDRLSQTQNEVIRLKKAYDDIVEKQNHLKVECRMGIEAMCVAVRRNEILQSELSNIMQNSNAKEISRLQSERDAAVRDYNLVMQERDSVHKEIDRLQEELSESQRTCSILETEKRMSASEIESLKEKLNQTTRERNRLAANCQELRKQVSNPMSMMSSNLSPYVNRLSPQQVASSMQRNLKTNGSSDLNDQRYIYHSTSTSSPSNYGTRLNNYLSMPSASLSTSHYNNHTWQSHTKDTTGIKNIDGCDRSTKAYASDSSEAGLLSKKLISDSIYDNQRLTSYQASLYQEISNSSKLNGINQDSHKQQCMQQRSQSPYSSLYAYGGRNRSTNISLADRIANMKIGSGDKGIANGQLSLPPSGEINSQTRDTQILVSRLNDLTYRLADSQCDARSLSKNRDVAMIERDKLVSERNSIRLLCDRLRRERDGAVSKLAEALHDSNNIRLQMAEQRMENMKEIRNLQERYDAKHDQDLLSSNTSITTNVQQDYSPHRINYQQQRLNQKAKNSKLFVSHQLLNNNGQIPFSSMMNQNSYQSASIESDKNSCDAVSSSTNTTNIATNQNFSYNQTSKCTPANTLTSTPLSSPTLASEFNFNPNCISKSKSQIGHDLSKLSTLTKTPDKVNHNNVEYKLSYHDSHETPSTNKDTPITINNTVPTVPAAHTTVASQCITSHESVVDEDFSFELPVIKLSKDCQENNVQESLLSKKGSLELPDGKKHSSEITNNNYREINSSSEQITTDLDNSPLQYGFEISDTSESGFKGIFVTSIRTGSQVEQFLEVGDQLLELDGFNLRQPNCDLKTTKKLFSYYYQKENPIRVSCRRRTLPTEPTTNNGDKQSATIARDTTHTAIQEHQQDL